MCVRCVGMCSYCDCRCLPVVSRLSRDHLAILKATDELERAVRAGDPGAPAMLDQLLTTVVAHGAYEEQSLFAELRENEDFAEAVAGLCVEHHDLYTALRRADHRPIEAESLLGALRDLRRHIEREEQGLFPAAVVLMGPTALERAEARCVAAAAPCWPA